MSPLFPQRRSVNRLALVLLAFAASCGDPAEPDPNQPPRAVGTIPDQILTRGHTTTVDVSAYFDDAEGGTLTYQVATSNATVVTVSIAGSVVTLTAASVGIVVVVVTAIDSGGLAAQQRFEVAVPAPPLVGLAADNLAAPESGGAVFALVLSAPPPTPISVAYTLGTDDDPGTSDADSADFAGASRGVVEIAAGASEAVIEIPFIDDEDVESTREVFTVSLDEPGFADGYELGRTTQAVVTIQEGVCDRTPEVRDQIMAQMGVGECTAIEDRHLGRIVIMQFGGFGSIESWLPDSDGPIPHACADESWFSVRPVGDPSHPSAWSSACTAEPARDGVFATGAAGSTAIHTLKTGDFAGLSNLNQLVIANSGLAELPPRIFADLENLAFLILANNRLARLPEDVFTGPSGLQILALLDNGLTEIPAGIADLSRLVELILSSNQLTELPEAMFSGLTSLRSVWLDRNQLTRLPAQGPSNAEFLVLTSNQLTEVPPGWFSGAPGLIRIKLEDNQLVELPPGAFAGLANLQELQMSQNRLARLPDDAFSDLANLRQLMLGSNELTALTPDMFSGLSNLEWLALDLNPLGELPAGVFDGLSRLQRLWLSGNGLRELPPDIFAGLPELAFLALAENELGELPDDVFANQAALTVLFLAKNRIPELPPQLLGGLPLLERLYLHDNQLSELPPGMFVGLSSLVRLSLDGNPGAPFPVALQLDRVDDQDVLAPSPGNVSVTAAAGAPFAMRIPLSAHGGELGGDAVVLRPGDASSQEVTVIRSADNQGGTQVSAGPAPGIPHGVTGVALELSDPLVLFGTVSNLAPVAVREIPWYRLRGGGEGETVDLSRHFRDPDGEELVYEVTSDNIDIATVTVAGSQLTVSPGSAGTATVSVTAADLGGLEVSLSFPVSVRAPVAGSFDMDVVLVGSVTEEQRAAFDEAADWWMSILADMELPDVPLVEEAQLGCGGIFTEDEIGGAIDDLLVVASVQTLDGPGGILAGARPCSVREGSMLPFLGIVQFDKDDVAAFEGSSDLVELILHEVGHVLGIGSIWADFGLLREPSLQSPGADTHFAGPLAIAAFNEAGGDSYGDAKVPVENQAGPGSGDSHWRQSVFVTELMTPFASVGTPDPLSAITIQSLADLGYTVDVGLADPFTLQSAAAADREDLNVIDLGNDILKGPITVVGRDGRVVRVIVR